MRRELALSQLANSILALQRDHPLRVAFDGVDAAGKTVLANELVELVQAGGRQVMRASIDGFHNPRSVRYRRGPDSPEGYFLDSFNYQALKSALLGPLGPGGSGIYQVAVFDFRRDAPVDTVSRQAAADSILLFDGVFLLRSELAGCWDYTIFVDVSFEVSVRRAMERDRPLFGDPQAVWRRYEQRYVPGQQLYLAACHPKEKADVVFENNDPLNPIVIENRLRA